MPAPVPPLVTPNVPDVIAEAAIAIAVELAELIRPFASTRKAATALAEPWSAAVIVKLVKSVLATKEAPFASKKAELAYDPALTALASAVAAEVVALFATPNAELAYEPAFTALASAVAALVVAELATPKAVLA